MRISSNTGSRDPDGVGGCGVWWGRETELIHLYYSAFTIIYITNRWTQLLLTNYYTSSILNIRPTFSYAHAFVVFRARPEPVAWAPVIEPHAVSQGSMGSIRSGPTSAGDATELSQAA